MSRLFHQQTQKAKLPIVYVSASNGELTITNKVIPERISDIRGLLVSPNIEISLRLEEHFYTWSEAKQVAARKGASLLSVKELEYYTKAQEDYKETVLLLREHGATRAEWLWQGQPTWCEEDHPNDPDVAYTIEFEPLDHRLEDKTLHYWCRLVWHH